MGPWDGLVAHCDQGDTRIHKNLLENAIHHSAFSGSRASGSSGIPTPATVPLLPVTMRVTLSDVASPLLGGIQQIVFTRTP